MNEAVLTKPGGLGIAQVERDTGISKDQLRMWERRYGFPQPGRDASGERAYSLEQVEKLRLIRRLMDAGLRPGKLIHAALPELARQAGLSGARPAAAAPPLGAPLRGYLDLLTGHGVEDLRRALHQELLRHGLARFVTETAQALNGAVGEAWARGEIEVFQEHLYAESMQVVLRGAIAALAREAGAPRVLLTTLPGEEHGLGLLMAEALLSLEGAYCVSLGVRTPLRDIALAARAQRIEVVALSFSASYPAAPLAGDLADLRRRLPGEIEIWVGGAVPGLASRAPAGVRVLEGLRAIAPTVAGWRARAAGQEGA